MKTDKFIVFMWFFLPIFVIFGAFYLVHSSREESQNNLIRAETFLSNTWASPYEIDKDRLSNKRVVFYSDGHMYEIDTLDWTVERR